MRFPAYIKSLLETRRLIALIALLAIAVVCPLIISPWFAAIPGVLFILMLVIAALPYEGRKITPEQWADELEKHLLPNEGAYDWDDATSVALADERLERLRCLLVPGFDRLDTPQKKERLRKIIEALRRGEVSEA